MIQVIGQWFKRYFSDPEAVLLFVVLLIGFGLIVTIGGMLAPVIASIVIAYLLNSWVKFLQRFKVHRVLAVWVSYLAFLGVFLLLALVLSPIIWKQLGNLFNDLPTMVNKGQALLSLLPEKFPQFITEEQLDTLLSSLVKDVHGWGKVALSASLSSIPGVIAWLVYLVLVPLMVFFFLKDHKKIIRWCLSFVPKENRLLAQIWQEVDGQIGNYVRGKVTEIIVVTIATYAAFYFLKMQYAMLLAFLVGLSVVVPYVGAAVVTIPVAIVAYLQWGWGSEFGYLIGAYAVIQALDGNVLVPLLFSEAVNLHPVAIIIAILLFGGFWGFWGIFFAIPLATLIKAVLGAWPRDHQVPHYRS